MATRTRIQPIDTALSVLVDKRLSREAQQEAIADFAREVLREAEETNRASLGRVPAHKTFVDRRPEAPLETVKPRGGQIIFEFELVGDLLRTIYQALRDNSPVVSGAYREGHRLFADGKEIDLAASGAVPEAEQYVFVNLVPYARRLEIGKTKSGRPFSVQVPPRIYERVAEASKRRFGNLVNIRFSYRAPLLGNILEIPRIGPLLVKRDRLGRFLKGSHVRAGNQFERALRNPAIVISPR